MFNDNTSIESSKHDCRLGINKNTGRLQWCPRCNCTRILIAIPAALLPVLLLFLFLLNFEVAGTFNQKSRNFDFGVKESNDFVINQQAHCVAIRAQLSEVFDLEDRDLMKDVRTSFIPSQPLIIPMYCKDLLPVNDAKIQNELNLLNYIHRRRRQIINGTQHDNLFSYEVTTTEIVTTTDEPMNHTEVDTERLPRAVSLQSFWKGEGAAENIRATQAAVMKQYIDYSVDPCVDFYQYACGNWENLNPIPKDKAAFDTFEKLRESLDTVLRDLLLERAPSPSIQAQKEESGMPTKKPQNLSKIPEIHNSLDISVIHRPSDILRRQLQLRHQLRKRRTLNFQEVTSPIGDAEKKARDLFISCMNYEIIEGRGLLPLHKLLKELGGWPVLEDNWDESNFDWLNTTAYLRRFNNDIFILEWIGPDIKNSDENVIQFDQTVLGLPTRDYFLKEGNRVYLDAYRDYMLTIMNLLGAKYTKAVQTVSNVINFEINLGIVNYFYYFIYKFMK